MFDPQEFYKLAVLLFSSGQYTEALGRTIISRAYYASFLKAREKAVTKWKDIWESVKIEKCKGGSHWQVRETLKRAGHPNISGKLKALHSARISADYNLETAIDKDEVDDVLKLAKNLLELIKNV
ncbi:hypothetical protein DRO54_02050 [Candidatus Bathyarchaeota archaeon]|nr:MAG: hypothetical protein DRO54_02050 [Candidatus Bathyarchaeota archaeon]